MIMLFLFKTKQNESWAWLPCPFALDLLAYTWGCRRRNHHLWNHRRGSNTHTHTKWANELNRNAGRQAPSLMTFLDNCIICQSIYLQNYCCVRKRNPFHFFQQSPPPYTCTHWHTNSKIKRTLHLQTERLTVSHKEPIRTTTSKTYSGKSPNFKDKESSIKCQRKSI